MTKILIIEDEDYIRELILDILTDEGFEVIEAENGKKGIELAYQEFPDLIISDIMMPELDGYGVLKELRKDPNTVLIPFIFLTAKSSNLDVREGMKLGADDYLTKPFTEEELLSAVNSRLKRYELIKSYAEKQLKDLRQNITLALPHELRTPLNGILGSAGFLRSEFENLEKSDIEEMLECIEISGQRLYQLIQRYLLYIQLENINYDAELLQQYRQEKNISITGIIQEIVSIKERKESRKINLSLQDCPEKYSLQIKENHYRQLLTELIDNALKFSNPDTPIIIEGIIEQENWIISITNKGRGMTPEQINNIGAYLQFNRKIYEQQGTGLGLAIAQKIVNIYQGKLSIKSQPNQETTVIITLPLILN